MKASNFAILYVKEPRASAAFYEKLLGLKPVQAADTFALFVMPGGFKLGLWQREDIEPATTDVIGGSEIMFDCENDQDVDAAHGDWEAKGVTILQQPSRMPFGYTFTGADPDGHRLRVYHPAPAPV